jgi:hypothetical protein
VGAAYTVPPKSTAVGRRHAIKRNSRRLSGWIVLVVIALSVGMIGAAERLPPEGPLALLYAQIQALFAESGELAAESDDQQAQINQLRRAVCGLSTVAGGPTHPEFCEVVVTTCGCEQTVDCACDPGPYFELESCESASFPHPDFGEVPPPKCGAVAGCQGTFTRIAAGDVGSIEVDPNCAGGNECSGCNNNNDPPF